MTDPTPQQMRELAYLSTGDYRFRMSEVRTALRTAADQLEAVRKALDESIPPFNCELRPDGSEDPVMSAHVDGARDVYMLVDAALNGASDD